MNKIRTIHQESISLAYLKMLASYNDVTKIPHKDRDHDGIDCHLEFEKLDGVEFDDVKINIQVKSSINVIEKEDSYSYKLETKNYNKFCGKFLAPRVFAILQLPRDLKWVDFDEENSQLLARSKMFWYVLPKDAEKIANEKSTITINIPKDNYWSVDNFLEVCSNIVREFYSSEVSNGSEKL